MTSVGGVWVAAVTPRRANGHEIDIGATIELLDFLADRGVRGVALLGSTGEFLHFDFDNRQRLVKLTAKSGRLPVMVNVSHSTLDGSIRLAEEADGAGAAALLLMPPYFFRYSQEAIRAFYMEFIDQAAVKAPVFLYNIPFFTTPLDAQLACELLATGRFAGIKDSSGDWSYYQQLAAQRDRTPFTLLIGNDVIFTRGRSAGADGVVSGVACGVPELIVGLDHAIAGGDVSRVDRLQKWLEEFIAWIDSFPTPVGVKEAVSIRGFKGGPPAAPLGKEAERKLGEFREWFQSWLPAVQREVRGR